MSQLVPPAAVTDPVAETEPRRAPPVWELLTWSFLILVFAYLVAAIVKVVLLVEVYGAVERIVSDPQATTWTELATLATNEHNADTVYASLLFGYLFVLVGWQVLSRRVVSRYGGEPRTVLFHWSMIAWRFAVFASVPFAILRPRVATNSGDLAKLRDSVLSLDRFLIVFMSVRVLMSVLLLTAILVLSRRVRDTVRNSTVLPLPDELFRRRASASYPELSYRGLPEAVEPATVSRPADDAFWSEVADLVRRSQADLPVLESFGTSTRRWHLLSAGATDAGVPAVRTRLTPGSMVTVYPQPPQALDDRTVGQIAGRVRGLARAGAASTSIGLIEEAGTLTLRFDRLSTEEQLAPWLARARQGARAAAYVGDAPDILSAQVSPA